MENDRLIDGKVIVELLKAAGEETDNLEISHCAGGGNNRVFVVCAGGRRLIAKWYFSHPSDTRDRLWTEYAFLEYAHGLGIRCVPKPMACSRNDRIALYGFIEGRKLEPGEITPEHMTEAVAFFLALNGPERFRLAGSLADASEACFSIREQVDTVGRRIERLFRITPDSPENEEAVRIAGHLQSRLGEASTRMQEKVADQGFSFDTPLPHEFRCVSPSDFGFHNVLLRPSGTLCFIDFEYSGWDDPAKMACDFFCQPAVPVSNEHFEEFLERTMSFSPHPDLLISRAQRMLPLFQIKWCCILLNEFLPDSARRRRFAAPDADFGERKRTQLAKVNRLFEHLIP